MADEDQNDLLMQQMMLQMMQPPKEEKEKPMGLIPGLLQAEQNREDTAKSNAQGKAEDFRQQQEAKTKAETAARAAAQSPSPEALRRLALAKKKLDEVNNRRATFNTAHPEYAAKPAAMKAGKSSSAATYAIAGVAVLGVGLFAWRKFRK